MGNLSFIFGFISILIINEKVQINAAPIKQPGLTDKINATVLEKFSWSYKPDNHTEGLTVGDCRLKPTDSGLHQLLQNALTDSKLVEYRISVAGYDVNPLTVNNTWNYKPEYWARVASSHGQTILNLAFNYGVLSLMTLTFGITTLNVELEEVPKGCISNLSEEDKIVAVMDILLRDLNEHNPVSVFQGQSSVCHQYIRRIDSQAKFTDRCCYESRGSKEVECLVDIPNDWLNILDIFLGLMLVVVFMFGPIMMPDWVYTAAMDKVDYYVRLKEPLYKKLAVVRRRGYHKVTDIFYDDNHVLDLRNRRDFKMCRKILSQLPHDEIVPIKISQFDIKVNYKKLLVENNVPVGMLDSVFHAIFLCKMSELEAFQGCCNANLSGDRNCIKKQAQCADNLGNISKVLCCCCSLDGCRQTKCYRRCDYMCNFCNCCNMRRSFAKCMARQRWISVCNIFGRILLVLFILIPFYIRLTVYYLFEHQEIMDRRTAADHLGLEVGHNYRLMQFLTPTHPLYLFIYSIYFIAGINIAIFSGIDKKTRFQQVIMDAFMDMNNLNMLKAFEMLVINCLWPFKKYGCYGLFLGLILWPLLVPISTIVCSIYCLPLVFLTSRIIWYTFRGRKSDTDSNSKEVPLSQKFRADHVINTLKSSARAKPVESERYCYCTFYGSCFLNICLAVMSIITLYSVMLMLSEIVTFIAEIVCFTLMGLIVNASTVLKYGTLFLLVVLYCHDCYSSVNKTYLKLNKAIFKCVKDRLGSDIKEYTELPSEKQGFRGFKAQEASEQASYEEPDDLDKKPFHWKINDLIMFVDKEDTPRIPKRLFEMVCQIDAAGAPGPVYRSLLKATQKFIVLLLFLTLVFIIVMSFGDTYQVSSTNQMLATMAGGFMPFMFKNIFKPNKPDVETDLLSFKAKLDEIIEQYVEVWPMTEFIFDIEENPATKQDATEAKDKEGNDGGGGGKPDKGKRKKKDDAWMQSVQRVHTVNTEEIREKLGEVELEAAEGNKVDILVYVNEADQDWEYEESISDYAVAVKGTHLPNGKAADECDDVSVLSLRSHDFF